MTKAKQEIDPLHRKYIEQMLAVANSEHTGDKGTLDEALATDGDPLLLPGGKKPSDDVPLMKLLSMILEDTKLTAGREEAISQLLGERVRTRIGFKQGRITVQYHADDNREAKVALGLALLFETDMVHRLRRCPECRRFFVIWEAKKWRQQYCSAECAYDVQSHKANERVTAKRAGMSVSEWRKRQQEEK